MKAIILARVSTEERTEKKAVFIKMRKMMGRIDKRTSPEEVGEDTLYKKVVEFVKEERVASASRLQRKFKEEFAQHSIFDTIPIYNLYKTS